MLFACNTSNPPFSRSRDDVRRVPKIIRLLDNPPRRLKDLRRAWPRFGPGQFRLQSYSAAECALDRRQQIPRLRARAKRRRKYTIPACARGNFARARAPARTLCISASHERRAVPIRSRVLSGGDRVANRCYIRLIPPRYLRSNERIISRSAAFSRTLPTIAIPRAIDAVTFGITLDSYVYLRY